MPVFVHCSKGIMMSYDPRYGSAGLIELVLASLCIKVALASVIQSSGMQGMDNC